MTRHLILGLIAVLAFSATVAAQTDNKAAVEQATKAADSWLKLVDEGKYADSLSESASLMRAAISSDQWAQKVGAARKPLGAVTLRSVKLTQYATTLPGAPDGRYVVI